VLVAVDHSKNSREALLVASQVMARKDDSKIILVEAIDMPYGSQMSIGASRFVDLRENATEQLQKFAEDSGIDESKVNVVIASNLKASTAILEVARKRNASMIVMGSKGKGAVAATILGSTVENVAKAANNPLLIVKPVKDSKKG
jgi:nucleotide-binding universal stress UspA family protein